jgi:hypothetical protein
VAPRSIPNAIAGAGFDPIGLHGLIQTDFSRIRA